MLKKQHSIDDFRKAIKNGDRFALSRAITLVESSLAADKEKAAELLDACLEENDLEGFRIGISGPPGVGKSSFIEAMGMHAINHGHKVAVLAIDPSSSISGGSILADKTRMGTLANHDSAFIRPSPSGKSLGGVARNTREVAILSAYAGYDVTMIETVGVGQSETTVSQMVDCFVLLLQPGAGDEIQGIKRGILELADILLVNKADDEQLALARNTKSAFSRSLRLFPTREDGGYPSVYLNSSFNPEMISTNWMHIEEFIKHRKSAGLFESRRKKQNKQWFDQFFQDHLVESLLNNPNLQKQLKELRLDVTENRRSLLSAMRAVGEIITGLLGKSA